MKQYTTTIVTLLAAFSAETKARIHAPRAANHSSQRRPDAYMSTHDATLRSLQEEGEPQQLFLTTTYLGGTGQAGNIFDIIALEDITIQTLDIHVVSTIRDSYEVYTRRYNNNQNNNNNNNNDQQPQQWNMMACASLMGQGLTNPTPLPRMRSVPIHQNEWMGFYVTMSSSGAYMQYSYGLQAIGDVYTSNAHLSILEGIGVAYPFIELGGGNSGSRVWNGSVYYTLGTTNKTILSSAAARLLQDVEDELSALLDCMPSGVPSSSPTFYPTIVPSVKPSDAPSFAPSDYPSHLPSSSPTNLPSMSPSISPTSSPTRSPSDLPTGIPTPNPSVLPTTSEPTNSPTSLPTAVPTIIYHNTNKPSVRPSDALFIPPIVSIVAAQSEHPSASPTTILIKSPPTDAPSIVPSDLPSRVPSMEPSILPTMIPTIPTEISSSVMPSSSDGSTASKSSSPSLVPSRSPQIVATSPPSSTAASPSFYYYISPSSSPTRRPPSDSSWVPTTVAPVLHPTSSKPTVVSLLLPSSSSISSSSSSPTLYASPLPTNFGMPDAMTSTTTTTASSVPSSNSSSSTTEEERTVLIASIAAASAVASASAAVSLSSAATMQGVVGDNVGGDEDDTNGPKPNVIKLKLQNRISWREELVEVRYFDRREFNVFESTTDVTAFRNARRELKKLEKNRIRRANLAATATRYNVPVAAIASLDLPAGEGDADLGDTDSSSGHDDGVDACGPAFLDCEGVDSVIVEGQKENGNIPVSNLQSLQVVVVVDDDEDGRIYDDGADCSAVMQSSDDYYQVVA